MRQYCSPTYKRNRSFTKEQEQERLKEILKLEKVRARVLQGRIIVLAPTTHLIKKLQLQGVCTIRNLKKHDVIQTRKIAQINLDPVTIIEKYNDVWQGLLNYYSFVCNRCQLNYIQYLLHHSLACTFMNKFKFNSRRQVFKEYDKMMKVN
jgi:hypothetical protein